MQAVSCTGCGAEVLARKSSWEQSTVQWTAAALEQCTERQTPQAPSERPNRNAFTGCHAMRASIRAAAVRGILTVTDDAALKTNPADPDQQRGGTT